jgi:hypothetical protein
MRITAMSVFFLSLVALLVFSHRTRGDDAPANPPYDWKQLDAVLGGKGEFKDDVCTFTFPRTDLNVAVDSMDVPVGAGIESKFYFYRCTCGKMKVVGQFCCADYEANDVIDAIRPGAIIEVANVGPMFISDKPRVSIVRFQGEGDGVSLAKLLKAGLGWMGDARTATQPVK